MGLFSCFGQCCGTKKKVETQTPVYTRIPISVVRVKKENNVRRFNFKDCIDTKIQKEVVEVCQFSPKKEDRSKYRFRCCICYCFFSHVLECSKCGNYICIFDLEKYLVLVNKPACPFCSACPVSFKDIDTEVQKIKHYRALLFIIV